VEGRFMLRHLLLYYCGPLASDDGLSNSLGST
jgi:hypothetical protein